MKGTEKGRNAMTGNKSIGVKTENKKERKIEDDVEEEEYGEDENEIESDGDDSYSGDFETSRVLLNISQKQSSLPHSLPLSTAPSLPQSPPTGISISALPSLPRSLPLFKSDDVLRIDEDFSEEDSLKELEQSIERRQLAVGTYVHATLVCMCVSVLVLVSYCYTSCYILIGIEFSL